MYTLYYGDKPRMDIPPTPAGSEAFKKAGKTNNSDPKQEELGI